MLSTILLAHTHRKTIMSVITVPEDRTQPIIVDTKGVPLPPDDPFVVDLQAKHDSVLTAAAQAVRQAFPNKDHTITVTSRNVNPKSVEETKQIMSTFQTKMKDYPKHMSYEGSMVLCVLLSMKKVAAVSMRNVPSVDQVLIRKLLPDGTDVSSFDVKFDDNKDFILIFNPSDNKDISLTMFNTVAHPRPEDLVSTSDVPVQSVGDKIDVGGKIQMNKKTIQRMFGHEQSEPISGEKEEPRRVAATNKNAYEIRADVLKMAIDWSQGGHVSGKYTKDDDVINLAKKFYSFVENRR